MNKKYSELAELFRSEKTDEEILDFLLNFHKNDIADIFGGDDRGRTETSVSSVGSAEDRGCFQIY